MALDLENDNTRTVWTAPSVTGGLPFKHTHIARVFHSQDLEFGELKNLEFGVVAQYGIEKGSIEPQAFIFYFDADRFNEQQVNDWLAKTGVKVQTVQPDSRFGLLHTQPTYGTGIPQQDLHGDDMGERAAVMEDGTVRTINLFPETCDAATMSVRAIIATEMPVISTELKSGKPILEVWCMDGMECPDTIPLLDDHNRRSVRNIVGSVRGIHDIRLDDGSPAKEGRLYVSESEPAVWQKIVEGHISQVSAGVSPIESETIPAGQVRTIRGANYSAHPDRPLFVRTRTVMREVSLTTFAADPQTKIRSLSEEILRMNPKTMQFLLSIGLKQGSTEDEAKTFYTSLPESTRALADEAATKADKKDDDDEEDDDKEKEDKERHAQVDADTVRREAVDGERKRVTKLRELGTGLPEDTVRKAIDDGWTPEVAAPKFLEMIRTRTAPAAQSRSFEKDVSAEVLGAAITIRSLSNMVDDKSLKNTNPLDLFGAAGYRPAGQIRNGGTDWVKGRPFSVETIRKQNEQLLERADRFSGLSMLDVCRMSCQLDGISMSGWDPGETIRSAASGSSLGAIFTTNFNALFLAGYLDSVDTTVGWVTESDVPNFMPAERATVGKMGGLRQHTPNRPAEHMDMTDWNEFLQVRRFSGQFKIDEMDLINDRFGALNQMSPTELGLAARQLRPNMVYSTLLKNPTLNQDSTALFDAAHGNYVTGATTRLTDPTDVSAPVYAKPIQDAISAIGQQRMRNRPLNLFPRYLLVPPSLRWAASVLLQSAERVIATGSGGTYNPLRDLGIEPRVEARLNATGCPDPTADDALVAGSDTAWHLVCQPGEQGAKTIEVGYLRGTGRAPKIRSFVMEKGEWGIGWDVVMDLGVTVLDFRCMYKGAGA